MEFYLYKIIQALLLPPALLLEAIIISLVLLKRGHIQAAKKFLIVIALGYYVLSINAGASLLRASLERGITQGDIPTSEIEAIVILGGGALSPNEGSESVELGEVSRERLEHGMNVYREHNGSLPILYSGGSGDPSVPVSYEAQSAQAIAEFQGITKSRFFIESASRTTAENATAVRAWLKHQFPQETEPTIILITSSWHMRRAMAVLSAQGIRVEPSPVINITTTSERSIVDFIPSERAFTQSTQSMHEWMGIVGYWVVERIT